MNKISKKTIMITIFTVLVAAVFIINPKYNFEVDQLMINNFAEKNTPRSFVFNDLNSGKVESAFIELREDGKIDVSIEASIQSKIMNVERKANFNGVLNSSLYYEDGSFYLDEPNVKEINNLYFELGKTDEKIIKLGKKLISHPKFFKSHNNFDNESKESALKEKAKSIILRSLEEVPIYTFNFGVFYDFALKQALGDVLISENKVTLVLEPFSLLFKGIMFLMLTILLTIGLMKNPDAMGSMIDL